MEAGRGVAVRHGIGLAAEGHCRHQAGEDIGRVFHRVCRHQRVQRLEQLGDVGCGLCVQQEGDVDARGAQAGLAEQALVQRAGVERDPFERDAGALAPLGRGVASLGAGQDRTVHTVAQDGELFRTGLQPGGRRHGRHGHGKSGLHPFTTIPHGGSFRARSSGRARIAPHARRTGTRDRSQTHGSTRGYGCPATERFGKRNSPPARIGHKPCRQKENRLASGRQAHGPSVSKSIDTHRSRHSY